MRIISAAPVLPKPKPITGVGDAKQLSSSFTRSVQTTQPNNGAGYMYSGSPGSDAARAPFYPTLNDPGKTPPTATATATTPTPKTPTGPTANPGGPGKGASQSVYDLSTDPIVQKIRSLNQQNFGQSVASADAARKQALIDAGFGDLARATQFGGLDNPITGDEATALAASSNPFSLAMNLARAHLANQEAIDKNAGHSNTFFSSTRANQLGEEGRNYLGGISSAQGQLRQALNGILSGLVNTRASGQQAEADAIAQARQQAVQNAISSGQTFAGYDANGNPIFKQPGSNSGVDTTSDASNPAGTTAAGTAAVTPGIGGASLGVRDNPGGSESYANQGVTVAPTATNPKLAEMVAAARLRKLLTLPE